MGKMVLDIEKINLESPRRSLLAMDIVSFDIDDILRLFYKHSNAMGSDQRITQIVGSIYADVLKTHLEYHGYSRDSLQTIPDRLSKELFANVDDDVAYIQDIVEEIDERIRMAIPHNTTVTGIHSISEKDGTIVLHCQ